MRALANKDTAMLERICAGDFTIELVGGAELSSPKERGNFFKYAHLVMPAFGFGLKPRWELAEYRGEPSIVGFRTLEGVEGVNEINRIETLDGAVSRVRSYCFCPEAMRSVATELGFKAIARPLAYRSPSLADLPRMLLKKAFRARNSG
jgi:hypothetical protein